MPSSFDFSLLKPVEPSDRAVLEPLLVAANPATCESNFPNMYLWGLVYKTRWALFNGRVWSHLELDDEMLYPLGSDGFPSAAEMLDASKAMRRVGFDGAFRQVPEEFLKARPEILESFVAEQVPEGVGEYLYSVERLANLPGSKLGKKKNLISQFKRLYPDFRAEPLDSSSIPACAELTRQWRSEKKSGLPLEIEHEAIALDEAFKRYEELGLEGVAAFATGRLVAFSMFSRVSKNMYTEHFEKADPSIKGAAQFINNETAKALLGKCEFLDREQDLGLEGLRHAKRSYDPLKLICNYSLIPKK